MKRIAIFDVLLLAIGTALSLAASGQGVLAEKPNRRLDARPAALSDTSGALWRADNPGLGVEASFDDHGVRLGSAAEPLLEIAMLAWTKSGTRQLVGQTLPHVEGNRLEYLRPGLTETIANRAEGLEITIAASGPVTLFEFDVTLGGGFEAVLEERTLRLRSADRKAGRDLILRLQAVCDEFGPRRATFSFDRLEQRLRLFVDGGACKSVTIDLVITRDFLLRPPAEDNALEGFARSVAVDGDLMIVGAPDDDALGAASGAAWLLGLESGAWEIVAKLTASDGAPFDHFGSSVALRNDTAVVSAPWHDGEAQDCGAVYIFEAGSGGGNWRQTARIEASQPAEYDWFGAALALDRETGDTIVVGAPAEDNDGPGIGAVFFFERDVGGNWSEVGAHRSGADFTGGWFGTAVAIDGDTAVVGANHSFSDTIVRRGSVHVFRRDRSGWEFTGSFESPIDGTQDAFGVVLALDDDVLVTRRGGANSSSSVPVLVHREGEGEVWDLVDRLRGHWRRFERFPLDIVGDTILVGMDDVGGEHIASGAVHLWNRTDDPDDPWQLANVVEPSTPIPWLHFGAAAALDRTGSRLVVGAGADKITSIGHNAAWVFDLEPNGGWLEACRVDPPPSPSSRFQAFGQALAAEGDLVLVGAPNRTGTAELSGPGLAYVFERSGDGWSVVARFEGEQGRPFQQFGAAVALKGDRAAVLAPRDAAYAYVFARGTGGAWRLEARMPVPADGNDSDCPCGTSVAITDTTLAVGRLGAVTVYERDGDWHETTTLRGEAIDSLSFGTAVALEGDTLVVGSPWGPGIGWPPPPARRASVQVFTRESDGSWVRRAVLTAPDQAVGTEFGSAVALSGDTIVVAARETNSTAEFAGAAYVFESDDTGWHRVAELVPRHAVLGTRACGAVALDGEVVLCGSSWATLGTHARRSGTVTVFMRNRGGMGAWGEVEVLDWEGEIDEHFGAAVAVHQRQIWIGVPGDDGVGENSGAVVTYDLADITPRRPGGRIR